MKCIQNLHSKCLTGWDERNVITVIHLLRGVMLIQQVILHQKCDFKNKLNCKTNDCFQTGFQNVFLSVKQFVPLQTHTLSWNRDLTSCVLPHVRTVDVSWPHDPLLWTGSGSLLMLFCGPSSLTVEQSLHILSARLLLSSVQPAQLGTSSQSPDLWGSSLLGTHPNAAATGLFFKR